jgi:hypothetical protein
MHICMLFVRLKGCVPILLATFGGYFSVHICNLFKSQHYSLLCSRWQGLCYG